jgi:hypothetical protein
MEEATKRQRAFCSTATKLDQRRIQSLRLTSPGGFIVYLYVRQAWQKELRAGTLQTTEMTKFQHRRAWFWIAAAVLLAAIVLLLVPHANSGHAGGLLVFLPVFFVGLISPLILLGPVAPPTLGYVHSAPPLPSTFQRPPPFRRS